MSVFPLFIFCFIGLVVITLSIVALNIKWIICFIFKFLPLPMRRWVRRNGGKNNCDAEKKEKNLLLSALPYLFTHTIPTTIIIWWNISELKDVPLTHNQAKRIRYLFYSVSLSWGLYPPPSSLGSLPWTIQAEGSFSSLGLHSTQ